MGITGKTMGSMFAPVPVEMACYEPETVGCKYIWHLTKINLCHIIHCYFFFIQVNACQKTKTSVKRQAGVASDLTQIVEASQQMENMLDIILSYVDDVISGAKTADNTFGRLLLDMIHSVPKMSPEEFEEMLNSNRKARTIISNSLAQRHIIIDLNEFQDLLMVLYLSQLTKTQLSLNEKLTLLTI